MRYNPRIPDEGINSKNTTFFYDFAKYTFQLFASLVVIVVVANFIVDFTVSNLSFKSEKYLAKKLHLKVFNNTKKSKYLSDVATKLYACSELPYEVHISIVDEETPNAFAVIGGEIFVTQGLLEKVQSENELSFIIGHELGHFKHRDHLKNIGHNIIFQSIGSLLGFESNLFLHFSSSLYSQEAELQADLYGLDMVACVYGNAVDTVSFFKKMDDKQSWKYIGATHPDFSKRIENLSSEIKKRNLDIKTKPIVLKPF
jgi:Zn-dependent protease with chaperone function